MWTGPRPTPTCLPLPSFILIHPTVWPQYTNITDRTDRQPSDSIGRTVLQTVAQKSNVYVAYVINNDVQTGCIIITSPAGAVAKYCDKCVCLSVSVSPTGHLRNCAHARSLPNFLCMLPMSVARSSSGKLTIGRIAYCWEYWQCTVMCSVQKRSFNR